MDFKIELSALAIADIEESVAYIQADSVLQAQKWLDELTDALNGLALFPKKYASIPESASLKRELRSFHHYSHRVIFELQEAKMVI